ncbi:hypothetical protein PCANC_05497 [Puccinia coronata f. sp. avenae]|uniref:Uncharacterized protein n=1 Tax=Puccinia coronata f. sp. avenae TaxID=200324 RepID=A0A2N5UMP8_9BASI|nr:hypothetical protein PCANC_05497 [Puccinia coronata f. sp. avenae]PLW39019.1 hypothetical protein PCASD_08444 [Puccinia coronata f. sp. avenae]
MSPVVRLEDHKSVTIGPPKKHWMVLVFNRLKIEYTPSPPDETTRRKTQATLAAQAALHPSATITKNGRLLTAEGIDLSSPYRVSVPTHGLVARRPS